jgi:hypothetical protein
LKIKLSQFAFFLAIRFFANGTHLFHFQLNAEKFISSPTISHQFTLTKRLGFSLFGISYQEMTSYARICNEIHKFYVISHREYRRICESGETLSKQV